MHLQRWLAGEARFDITPYLRTLPDDIDPAIALPVIMKLFDRHSFGKSARSYRRA